MKIFELYLSPINEKQFRAIVTQSGETDSSLPFSDGKNDWRMTLLRTLEVGDFNPQYFSSHELEWMRSVGILTQEENNFAPNYLVNIGQALYSSLFPSGKVENAFKAAMRLVESQNSQLHIQLRFEDDSSKRSRLADYPWELLHDGQDFLLHQQVTFSRYIAHDALPPNLPPVEQLNVLLVSSAAFDREVGLKKLSNKEKLAIYKGLESASEAGNINLQELDATVEKLREYLTENQGNNAPHVIHFDGHGIFGKRCQNDNCRTMHKRISVTHCSQCNSELPEAQGYLAFESEAGKPDYVSAKELGALLQIASFADGSQKSGGVALVVLSACQSAMALEGESVFYGTAQNLINHRIPAVVAMQYSVSVDAATEFAKQFYRSLGQRNSLALAISHGRKAMGVEGNQWYRPVLYLRWQDNEGGQLFDSCLPSREDIREELIHYITSRAKKLDLPNPPAPSHLLRAEYGVVPFTGREDALAHMLSWCKSPPPFSMNILHGQAGMGKTRLMQEVCFKLEAEDWLTGFFQPRKNGRKDGSVTDEAIFQRMLKLPFPFLLIIDYTENQYCNVELLLEFVRERNNPVQFRLVLIARQLGILRDKINRNYIRNGMFADEWFSQTQLIDIEHKHIRQQLFESALTRFHELLNPDCNFEESISLSHRQRDFSEDALGRPLIIQLAALVEVFGYQETKLERFFECLISHEERYWMRLLQEQCAYPPRTMDRMERSLELIVAINTLLGGQTYEQLQSLAKQMPTVFYLESSELLDILEILATCYQKESEILDPLQPDLIGEWLIAVVLDKKTKLLQNLIACLDNYQVKSVFDVLNRTASHFSNIDKWLYKGLELNPVQFAPIMLTVASETGGEAAKAITKLLQQGSLDPDTTKKLEKALPKYTIDLREARVLIVEQCLRYLTENEDISERARLLSKLSAYLLELARLDDAQNKAQEAAEYYEIIALDNPSHKTKANLALSINIYAVALQRLGRIREAKEPAKKAFELYKTLVHDGDESLSLRLASTQNTLATILGETGAVFDALELIESASQIYEKYREQTSYTYTVELASCLSNKALLLRHLGKHYEALNTADRSTQLLREFIKDKQGQCHSELAASLTELANRYYELGMQSEALNASKEAEHILRGLAKHQPDIFKRHLAKTLLNQASILRTTRKEYMADQPAQEAVRLYQEIFSSGSTEIAYEFITALSNLGDILRDQKRPAPAKELFYRAIALLWEIQNTSNNFSPSFLANSVIIRHNLSLTLMNLEDYNEALKVSAYALSLLVPNFEENRTRYLEWMRKLIANYKNACNKSGQAPAEEFLKYLDI